MANFAMKKLNFSDMLQQRKRNAANANSHTSTLDVDNTMCGCEIDPISTRGHCLQLLCMIGLPVIPVLALLIYSSLKLSGVVRDYNNLQVCIFHLRIINLLAKVEASQTIFPILLQLPY